MLPTGTGTAIVTPFGPDGTVDHRALAALAIWQVDEGIDFLVACGVQTVRFDACAGRTRRHGSRANGAEPGAKPQVLRRTAILSPQSCHRREGVAVAGVTLAESARSMHVTHPPRPQGRTSRFHSLKAGGRKVRG